MECNDYMIILSLGSYAYIEASSPRKKGDSAILLGPIMSSNKRAVKSCLSFYYHMNGGNIGTLRVLHTPPTHLQIAVTISIIMTSALVCRSASVSRRTSKIQTDTPILCYGF